MRKGLVIFLVLVIGLVIAADRIGLVVAQDEIAKNVATQYGLDHHREDQGLPVPQPGAERQVRRDRRQGR
jgi:hypothetical protein